MLKIAALWAISSAVVLGFASFVDHQSPRGGPDQAFRLGDCVYCKWDNSRSVWIVQEAQDRRIGYGYLLCPLNEETAPSPHIFVDEPDLIRLSDEDSPHTTQDRPSLALRH
jgi:hypothetical protein